MRRAQSLACPLLLLCALAACGGDGTGSLNPSTSKVVITPPSAALQVGERLKFTAQVSGTKNQAVEWSIQEGEFGGVINRDGNYLAPSQEGTFHVVARSQVDGAIRASAEVRVTELPPEISVAISPANFKMVIGTKHQFTAFVSGTSEQAVTWSLEEGPMGGRIDVEGYYTAPATPGVFHLIATSVVDPQKFGRTIVNVVNPPKVTVAVDPASVVLKPGLSQQFSATVTGIDIQDVDWSVQEPQGGSVSLEGIYTAPSTLGTYHLLATSREDSTAVGSATVKVADVDPVEIAITPTSAVVEAGETLDINATITGGTSTLVRWSVEEGPPGGTVSPGGLYTAPYVPGTYHVRATADEDRRVFAITTLTVTPGILRIAVSPTVATLLPGQTQSFQATVKGHPLRNYVWSVVGGDSHGTISPGGLYTAPAAPGVYELRATTQADSNVYAVAFVTVVLDGPFSVSGNISYGGSKSGRVYLLVKDSHSEVVASTSVTGPGPYTLRGLRGLGTFTLEAFMDTLGTARSVRAVSPAGQRQVMLAGADVGGLTVTLADPTPPVGPPSPPSHFSIDAGGTDGAALVRWASVATADRFRVYWSQSPNPGPSNYVGVLEVAAQNYTNPFNRVVPSNFVAVTGLSPGATYYFSVSSMLGGYEGPVATRTEGVKASAPSGGTTVTGTVEMPGLSASGALYVALTTYDKTHVVRIAAPSASQPFSISGVEEGNYDVYALLDINGDGQTHWQEPNNLNRAPAIIVGSTAAPPPVKVPLVIGGRSLRVRTVHTHQEVSTYSVLVEAQGGQKLPISAALTGPGLGSAWDLPMTANYFYGLISLGTALPVPGAAYALTVQYSDGTSETANLAPTFIEAMATPLSPVGQQDSRAPTFTWLAPSPAPVDYVQRVVTMFLSGVIDWISADLPSSTLSLPYGDGQLPPNLTYGWYVEIEDAEGNVSRRVANFQTPKL